jgi:hypothetical protein
LCDRERERESHQDMASLLHQQYLWLTSTERIMAYSRQKEI